MSDYCISHIEKYWKELTELSDKSFAKKDFSTALFFYQEAFYRAEVLVKEVDRCICLNIPFVQIYIQSCCNLAKIYQTTKKIADEEAIIKDAISFLLTISKYHILNTDEIESQMMNIVHFLPFREENL
jgi:hypothetical protein